MGKFVISLRKNGEYQFILKAYNGQQILWSEGYAALASCENGIASVRMNSQHDGCFDKRVSSNSKLFFYLKATNGQIIGRSGMYESEAAMDNGIASVMKNAPDAEIENEFS